MPDNPPVRYERQGSVAWLTIDRPQARNALNKAARQGLFDGLRAFNADAAAQVLILTGTGDQAFCAGADLKEMGEGNLTVPPPDFIPQIGRNITVDKPVIGAINGACLAGGFLLAMNCDLLIAAEHATLGITEVRVGRGSPWAVPLLAMVPRAIALEILLTGQPITAQRAFDVGLVNAVVPRDELRAAAQQLAETIAANAPLSVQAAKRMSRLLINPAVAQAFVEAERIYEPVYHSEDAQEGPRAFTERRTPRWQGR